MNPERAQEDVLSLNPGAVVIFDEPLKLDGLRTDVTFYPVPFDRLTAATGAEPKLRKLVRNMVYVGVRRSCLPSRWSRWRPRCASNSPRK